MAPREQQGELQKLQKKFMNEKCWFLTGIENIICALKKISLKNEIFCQQNEIFYMKYIF